jgi:predicted ATP-dependent endonuclease of OLD family
MRLKSIEVSEFQSIRNSNRFDIGDITCLVGKNEAGKTALLQAIYRLNPIIENDGYFDVTDDYPRSDVEDYQYDVENGKRKPAIVIEAIFELDKKEIQPIESDFGNGVLKSTDLTLSKGYENEIVIDLEINEKIVISSILKRAQLPSELNKHFIKFTDFDSFTDEIEQYNNSDNNEHINRLKEQIKNISDDNGLIVHFYSKYIESFVPKFLYFDEYFLMRGCENIEKLKARIENNQLKKSDHPLLGLIDLARLNIDDLLNPDRTQWLINKLQGASNHLNKKILDYWSQNKHLEIEFDVRPGRPGDPEDLRSGNNLWAHVRDTKHKVKTMLGTRSRGFVWFFSFLAWYYQQQKKQEPLILLLDEPGLFLHGKAQGDLLKYMESELKGNHQVIYTTHSPFMVDPQKFERVRIVQDKGMDTLKTLPAEEEGTKVLTDILDATDDSLFPLQGALVLVQRKMEFLLF